MKFFYYSVIGLLLFGNAYGFYNLWFNAEAFTQKFPQTKDLLPLFRVLPLLNIVALLGLLFWQEWAVWLFLICAFLIIIADVYYGIKYHLPIAILSTALVLWLVYRFWDMFV